MDLFDRTKKNVKSIYDDFSNGNLVVDPTYQRRRVWMEQDKVRLIETILMGLIIPEVFFWPASVDPETGDSVTHIVDGQQRIDAIVDFIDGKYKLAARYFLDEQMRGRYGNLEFSELPPDAKSAIWTYKLSVVDIDKSWSKEQIMVMFYRLNLTNYNLNEQEKRNSKVSAFGDKAEALATLDFWSKMHVFSAADARRMKDAEYCCSIYILAKEGIIDQTNSKRINQYYDDYKEKFDEDESLTNRVLSAMEIIDKLTDKTMLSFVSKKAQMYTMFCLAFRLVDDGIGYSENVYAKLKLFIEAYNLFRNEYELTLENEKMASLYEAIKKYKLATSEGINKYQNRVIRYEQLYRVCVLSEEGMTEILRSMIKILTDQKEGSTAHESVEMEIDQ